MRTWIVQGLTPILCGLALVLGVIVAGRFARASLRDNSAYNLAFIDIDCQPPDGMSRNRFLRQVRSLTRQPPTLHLLDADLDSRLHRVFLAHPWVESVRRVSIGKPVSSDLHAPKSVRIELEYRRAVLAVALFAEEKSEQRIAESQWRMVDRYGVLLPSTETRGHLPVLTTEVAVPTGPPGSHWGDARVTAAAQTAAFLQVHLARLRLDESEMEVVGGEVVFHRPGVRIVWGHVPGQEKEDEATAQVKLHRLLEYAKEHGDLESLEHDVRLMAYQGHFPLPASGKETAVSLYEPRTLPSRTDRDQISNSSRSWRSCFNEARSSSASASPR